MGKMNGLIFSGTSRPMPLHFIYTSLFHLPLQRRPKCHFLGNHEWMAGFLENDISGGKGCDRVGLDGCFSSSSSLCPCIHWTFHIPNTW